MDIDRDSDFDASGNYFEKHTNVYACSYCGTYVSVDPYLTYTYDDIVRKRVGEKILPNFLDKNKDSIKHWHKDYAYSKEVEPDEWLTFCTQQCENRYNRQYEDGWEFSPNKK